MAGFEGGIIMVGMACGVCGGGSDGTGGPKAFPPAGGPLILLVEARPLTAAGGGGLNMGREGAGDEDILVIVFERLHWNAIKCWCGVEEPQIRVVLFV